MKRVVNGVTYNTETSTLIAESTWDEEPAYRGTVEGKLYKTRGGAYFLHEYWLQNTWVEANQEHEQRERDEFRPMSAEEAEKWTLTGQVEIFGTPFDEPPEAEAEAEPSATIYVRVPTVLKQRVDQAAAEAKLSVNAWAMKCMERCITQWPITEQNKGDIRPVT